jgi:hypothetical protein
LIVEWSKLGAGSDARPNHYLLQENLYSFRLNLAIMSLALNLTNPENELASAEALDNRRTTSASQINIRKKKCLAMAFYSVYSIIQSRTCMREWIMFTLLCKLVIYTGTDERYSLKTYQIVKRAQSKVCIKYQA